MSEYTQQEVSDEFKRELEPVTFNNGDHITEQELPIAEIFCDGSFNCRGDITKFDVMDLMAEIKRDGLLQAILVQPFNDPNGKYKYKIVVGHRRYTACKHLGLPTIRASIRTGLSELDAMRHNLAENIHRKDISLIKIAEFMKRFRVLGMDYVSIGKMVGFSGSWVKDRIDILQLPQDIQDELSIGTITFEQAKTLLPLVGVKEDLYATYRCLKESKARGESTINRKAKKISEAKVSNPLSNKIRSLNEIYSIQDMIMEAVGPCLEARVLGWVAGHVNTFELLEEIESYAEGFGREWKMPQEIRDRAIRLKELTSDEQSE